MTAAFAPFQDLASLLLPHAMVAKDDGAHDRSHLMRVWHNVCTLRNTEGGDQELLVAATLLHDCVAVEKNSPFRSSASRLAAAKAGDILTEMGWDEERIDAVSHAIEAHSFSAAITPKTLEARILQDADRLDAIGMVGVARLFYVAGRMGSQLYDCTDPLAAQRDYDDQRFALDHFQTKLLHLAEGFQTATGTRLAQERQVRLQGFVAGFLDEIGGKS
ncbi:HD domain-containing protein [Pseudomonas sp. Pseusp122]|uniref:HD domain-containing protein n=1 Tax=unclassified Pseudomonas TaxID=196821 RepID=UPI0039A72F99